MRRLILFRHGKAQAESASGDDFDRQLAPRGVAEATAMGWRLKALDLVPDLALVSTAARARETWDAACVAFPRAQARFEDDLYNADSGAVRRLAERAGETLAGTVMVVGHNPGLQELTVRLLREGSAALGLVTRAQQQFPTAAIAVFAFDENDRPAFEGLHTPEREA